MMLVAQKECKNSTEDEKRGWTMSMNIVWKTYRKNSRSSAACHANIVLQTAVSCTENKARLSSLKSSYFSTALLWFAYRTNYEYSHAQTFSTIILSRASSDNVTSRLHGNERHRQRSWGPPADIEAANCAQGRILLRSSKI